MGALLLPAGHPAGARTLQPQPAALQSHRCLRWQRRQPPVSAVAKATGAAPAKSATDVEGKRVEPTAFISDAREAEQAAPVSEKVSNASRKTGLDTTDLEVRICGHPPPLAPEAAVEPYSTLRGPTEVASCESCSQCILL